MESSPIEGVAMGTTQAGLHSNAFPSGQWKVPTACGPNGGNCVEVNRGLAGHVGVRDSKRRDGPILAFSAANWRTFVDVSKRTV
jgi:hypothetical protein